MSLRLTSTSTSTIRHHLRTLGSRIPHQWINIALLLPVAVFLALYAVNERRSGRIKSELEYERVVWPQYFGFPEWYGKPSLDRFAAGEERELEKDSVLPGKSLKTSTEPLQRPIRVLGLIRECQSLLELSQLSYGAFQLRILTCISRQSFYITWRTLENIPERWMSPYERSKSSKVKM